MKRKYHLSRRMVLLFLICSIMVSWFFVPEFLGDRMAFEVSAKVSKSMRKKALKIYRRTLDESDWRYFFVVDIDKDGMKELVISYESRPEQIYIKKYRKGLVYPIGEDSTTFGYFYNKKTKRIWGKWGGAGNIEDWYLTIKKGKLRRVYLSRLEERVVNGRPVYGYYYAGKKISKKAYFQKKRSWEKNSVPLKMHKLSTKNIKKYVR